MKWLQENLPVDTRLGYDPRLHRISWLKTARKELGEQVKLIPISENPIDLLWVDRPNGNTAENIILLEEKYTGESSIHKRKVLGQNIEENKCTAAFLTQLDSIAWILNIRGNDVPCNPVLLCHGLLHSDGSFDLFIDENRIPDGFHNHVGENVTVIAPDKIQDRLTELRGSIIQLDLNSSNLWSRNLITESGSLIMENNDPCALPKACKNNVEIQGMKNCHIRDAVAECEFLFWLDNEITDGNFHD